MRRRPAVILILLPVALLGCGSGDHPAARRSRSAPATRAPATPIPSATPTPTPPPKITSKVGDCFDGNCRLRVTGPVHIPLNAKKFYYAGFTVMSVTSDSLTFQVAYPQGGGSQQSLRVGDSGSFGFRGDPAIDVRLESAAKGKAVLAITPGKIE